MTSSTRNIARQQIVWRGITIEIDYEAAWLGSDTIGGMRVAHLQLRSVEPLRAPLPVTETGYRSHFINRDQIAELGGPVAYTESWLDQAAMSDAWRAYEQASRQLSLF